MNLLHEMRDVNNYFEAIFQVMNLFVVFDGDGIGQMVGRARLADDVELVRTLSRRIEDGNQVFKSWAESHGTNAIEVGGDEGAIEVPAAYLDELPAIKEKYQAAVGATCSIGVGMKLSEASRALVYAKVTGKNKICFYTEEMEEEISKLQNPSESDKISAEYMAKALPPTKGYWHPSGRGHQEILPEEFDDIHEIPVSNIHRLDYSVHPIDPRRVTGILGADPSKLPPAKGWPGKPLHHEGAYTKLTDDPVDPSHPEVYLTDGHHRAIAAMEAKRPLRIAFKWDRPHGRYHEDVQKSSPAMNTGPGAGFSGAAKPSAPTVDKPTLTQGDHEQGQSIIDLLAEDRPAPPEATHAAADFEEQLHQHAAAGEQEDAAQDAGREKRLEQVKAQLVGALQAMRAKAPLLEQVKQADPDAYNALTALSQAVIGFAREMSPPQPMAKHEDQPEQPLDLVHYSKVPGLKSVDTKHMGTGARSAEYKHGLPAVARAYYYRADAPPEPIVTAGAKAKYRTTLLPQQRLYDLGKDPENIAPYAREKYLSGKGLNSPQDTLLHDIKSRGYYGYHNSASSQPGTVALFYDHPVEEMGKDELEMSKKLAMPMPKTTSRHHVVLPPGSVKDNKVKVQHSDGGQGWVQVGAGQIRSQDPSGHPVSSLRPNSK